MAKFMFMGETLGPLSLMKTIPDLRVLEMSPERLIKTAFRSPRTSGRGSSLQCSHGLNQHSDSHDSPLRVTDKGQVKTPEDVLGMAGKHKTQTDAYLGPWSLSHGLDEVRIFQSRKSMSLHHRI